MNLQQLSLPYRRWRYTQQAKALQRRCNAHSSLAAIVDEVLRCRTFRANQKRSEILSLVSLLKNLKATYVCEIGAAKGGNLCLFSCVTEADARILSLDINYSPERLASHPKLGRPGQEITCIREDSHSSKTHDRTKHWLNGKQFDFLLIDGDHSLAGVSADYEMYAPLVRKDGLIAFHDIVPDFKTRHGTHTKRNVGQVPTFWQSLHGTFPIVHEFIEDPDQDGYGIGVLTWDGRPVAAS